MTGRDRVAVKSWLTPGQPGGAEGGPTEHRFLESEDRNEPFRMGH